jgi:hypothetical protein
MRRTVSEAAAEQSERAQLDFGKQNGGTRFPGAAIRNKTRCQYDRVKPPRTMPKS